MRYDRKKIRAAIKARIDEDNDWALYGRRNTSFGLRLPEWHFYMRDNNLRIVHDYNDGMVVDGEGNPVAKWKRKFSAKKVCLTYKELMPTIEWVA